MIRHAFPILLAATLGACSWGITLDSGGQSVRTAWDGNVAGCREIGQVGVSVLDHIGPVDRNDIKVRDELEVLASNEAASMGADTIAPLAEPRGGEQRWMAYSCGSHLPPAAKPAPRTGNDGVETFPIDD
jgi:hypothetical protein